MTSPKVFVLILSYNGVKWLKDCLPSVLAMDYPNFETVVIDNGSSDNTQEFVREQFPQVQLVTLRTNHGYPGGFNAGLQYAAQCGADYFLVMNNDTVIDPQALAALVEVAQSQERAGFVTGKVYFFDQRSVFQSVGKEEDLIRWSGNDIGYKQKDRGQYNEICERVFADDVYILVCRQMYDEVGGYDPQLYLQCEEFDWQVRAKKLGWKIYYTPRAKIWHRVSASTGGVGSPIINYFLERNRIIVLAKHGTSMRVLRYFSWSSLQATYRFIGALVQLDPNKIKPRLARLLGILAGVLWLINRQPATRVPNLIQKLT